MELEKIGQQQVKGGSWWAKYWWTVVVGRDPRDGTGKEGPLGEEGLDGVWETVGRMESRKDDKYEF